MAREAAATIIAGGPAYEEEQPGKNGQEILEKVGLPFPVARRPAT
jgi:hypothetical protein